MQVLAPAVAAFLPPVAEELLTGRRLQQAVAEEMPEVAPPLFLAPETEARRIPEAGILFALSRRRGGSWRAAPRANLPQWPSPAAMQEGLVAEPAMPAPGEPTTGRRLRQEGREATLLEPVVPAAELAALVTPPVGEAPGTGRRLQQVRGEGTSATQTRLAEGLWRG